MSVSGIQIKPHKLQNIKIYQHEHLPQTIQLRNVYPDFKEELRMHGRHHVCAMLRRFLHLIKKRRGKAQRNQSIEMSSCRMESGARVIVICEHQTKKRWTLGIKATRFLIFNASDSQRYYGIFGTCKSLNNLAF